MIQIGEVSDEEKPRFSSLQGSQTISNISLEEALSLFQLPKTLGVYKAVDVVVSNGRFGPYVRYDKLFVSLPKGADPTKLTVEEAIELILAKQQADAPIAEYEKMPVQKGVGRFGPFLKWNGMFINVSRKYDFDALTMENIVEIIEIKKQKDIDKILLNWEEEGIRVEKARWGRFNIIKGKIKIELPKTTNVDKLSLEKVQEIIAKNTKKKTPRKRKTTKK